MPAPRKADRLRQAADGKQTDGSYQADKRQTVERQPADTRQPMERHNLRLPPEYWRALEEIARRDARPMSELVREAVREYLQRH